MAASIEGVLTDDVRKNVTSSKILVVGAGGIGCELLKNLVLTGFEDIELIDLDTIDVSNLNRQFLFRKQHVGKSKALVARNSALEFNPDARIVAYHDSVMSSEYGLEFFKTFDVVMNALDNRAARSHVNRMCLAADVPLIESGTAGYLGQVTVIKKGLTECYECKPKTTQKQYPSCTIRNTPSEFIHCVVWAKHLFNQLFGEEDPDQDVSPDSADPELVGEAGQNALQEKEKPDAKGAGVERQSTRIWAMRLCYDKCKLFNKFFRDDIQYLLSMDKLWEKRRPPVPMDWAKVSHTDAGAEAHQGAMRDQRQWGMVECATIFGQTLRKLCVELQNQGDGGSLAWDKDDEAAMDFVTAAANIRAYIFGIPTKTRFEIKSMAGNIVPAIATTNAIVAGLIVLEALRVLGKQFDNCKETFVNRKPNGMKKILVPNALVGSNPKCYVCSSKPEVTVVLNALKTTIKALEDKILKGQLGMVAPDVEIDDNKGTIIISSEEGETEENNDKFLSDFGIGNGTRLKCDDFLQSFNLIVNIAHKEKLKDDAEFEVVGELSEISAQAEEAGRNSSAAQDETAAPPAEDDEDDDLLLLDSEDEMETEAGAVPGPSTSAGLKRKAGDDTEEPSAKKRPRTEQDSSDVEIID